MKIEGKKVIDAKRPLVLSITPKDVAKGKKRAPDCCAAAQACVRQLKADQARVFLSRVYVEFPDKWVRYSTPPALRTEIVSFDRGHRFEAGDYRLAPLQPTVALGKKRRNGRDYKGGKKTPQRGNRMKQHVTTGVRARAEGWTQERVA